MHKIKCSGYFTLRFKRIIRANCLCKSGRKAFSPRNSASDLAWDPQSHFIILLYRRYMQTWLFGLLLRSVCMHRYTSSNIESTFSSLHISEKPLSSVAAVDWASPANPWMDHAVGGSVLKHSLQTTLCDSLAAPHPRLILLRQIQQHCQRLSVCVIYQTILKNGPGTGHLG